MCLINLILVSIVWSFQTRSFERVLVLISNLLLLSLKVFFTFLSFTMSLKLCIRFISLLLFHLKWRHRWLWDLTSFFVLVVTKALYLFGWRLQEWVPILHWLLSKWIHRPWRNLDEWLFFHFFQLLFWRDLLFWFDAVNLWALLLRWRILRSIQLLIHPVSRSRDDSWFLNSRSVWIFLAFA